MSIWNLTSKHKDYPKLKEDIEVEVLIIGAGITGLTTAYNLRNHRAICVVDANKIGHGVTLNTTAKITYLQERIYTKIKNIRGKEKAIQYLKSQIYAMEELKYIIKKENITCNLEMSSSYLFSTTKKEDNKLKLEVKFLSEQGIDIKKAKIPNDLKYYHAYKVDDTYVFHPLKFLYGIADKIEKNVSIYENTKIIKIEKKKHYFYCYTENNCIKAKKVVLACHYPFFLFPLLLPSRCNLEKSYIVVKECDKNLKVNFINTNKPTYSCRYYQDENHVYQIFLAESHNLAFNNNDKKHFENLINNLNDKVNLISYSNVDIMTFDHMPLIGEIKKNMYIGLGYNTWGMTNGVLAGKILSNYVLGNTQKWYKIFTPKRKPFVLFLKFPIYMFSQMKSYIGTKLKKQKNWYSDQIITKGKISIYVDNDGVSHPVYNKCPHLGCSLIFNEQEKTWDCPCHSSRFDIDGNCIKGPSLYNIKYKN